MSPIADLPAASAMNKEQPAIVWRAEASSITPHLTSLTLPRSLTEATRDHIASRAIDRLHRYSKLHYGWDGYSGRTFGERIIEKAVQLVRLATHIAAARDTSFDAIVPGPAGDGSVDIEFRNEGKTLILIMYPDVVEVEIYSEDADQTMDHRVPDGSPALVAHLAWIVG